MRRLFHVSTRAQKAMPASPPAIPASTSPTDPNWPTPGKEQWARTPPWTPWPCSSSPTARRKFMTEFETRLHRLERSGEEWEAKGFEPIGAGEWSLEIEDGQIALCVRGASIAFIEGRGEL